MKKAIIFLILLLSMMAACFAQPLKADGISDDLPALKAFAKAGGGILPCMPYKIIRITDTWEIPLKISSNMFVPDGAIISDNFQFAKSTHAITINGNNCMIWLDNPDKTKPVISYNAAARFDSCSSGEICNLALKGVGTGLSVCHSRRLRLDNVNFYGFKNGLLLNNATNTFGTNLNFQYCQRAEFDIRSHSSKFTNTIVGNCNKGFEVRSNRVHLDTYSAVNCNIGLHLVADDNKVSNAVLESNKPGEGQLLIGDSTGDTVDGTILDGITITAPGLTAIKFLKTAGFVTLTGGRMYYTNFEAIGKPTLWLMNYKGTEFPTSITKKL